MRITLTVIAGPHEGQVFTFSGHDTFLVGRSRRAHFRLPVKDRYFSRIHFLVEINPPECGLMDMGSRNGTYVNGKRVDRCALKHGDQIRAGRSILRVSVVREEAEVGAPQDPAPHQDGGPQRYPPVPPSPPGQGQPVGDAGFSELGQLPQPMPINDPMPDVPYPEQPMYPGEDPLPPPVQPEPPFAPAAGYMDPGMVPSGPAPVPQGFQGPPDPLEPAPPVQPPDPLPPFPSPDPLAPPSSSQDRSQPTALEDEKDFIPDDVPGATSPAFELPFPDEGPEFAEPPIHQPPLPPLPADMPPPADMDDGFELPLSEDPDLPPEPLPFAKPMSIPPEPSMCRVCGNGMSDTPMSASQGLSGVCRTCQENIHTQEQPIPGYLVVRELGQGSMGVVQLALRQDDGLLVAIKTIIPAVACSPTQTKRFWREAEILKQLEHPHIVAFRDMGEAPNGVMYFAMDYVRGLDAGRLLRKGGVPFAIPRAVSLVCQLLDALDYAHQRGFVHRDIKPSNMLVTEEESREIVKVADFGLARVYQSSHLSGLTMTGDIGGTVAFMPPEQITEYREAKPAADQYSAAATLYNLLTGWYVYNLPHEFQKQLKMILEEDPTPIRARRSEIPEGLEQVIHRALAREPSHRWPDIRTMRQALLPYCN